MEPDKNRTSLLWDYLDGNLSEKERLAVETLLRTDSSAQKEFDAILDMNVWLKETELEQPSMRFSKNVMEEVAKYSIAPTTKSYVNKKIIFSIAAFFILIISGTLIYMFTQIDYSAAPSGALSVELPKIEIDWKKWINSTYVQVFLMADIVFGLMLLDRYLSKKKKAGLQ